jgi:hypothetical protein
MPPLSGYRNICDFIACAAYGTLLGAIKDENGSEFLYAAQVALATVPRESKTSKIQPRPVPTPPIYPTPPPLLPQPPKKKRVKSKSTLFDPTKQRTYQHLGRAASLSTPQEPRRET